jgi:hypothetical protein
MGVVAVIGEPIQPFGSDATLFAFKSTELIVVRPVGAEDPGTLPGPPLEVTEIK